MNLHSANVRPNAPTKPRQRSDGTDGISIRCGKPSPGCRTVATISSPTTYTVTRCPRGIACIETACRSMTRQICSTPSWACKNIPASCDPSGLR